MGSSHNFCPMCHRNTSAEPNRHRVCMYSWQAHVFCAGSTACQLSAHISTAAAMSAGKSDRQGQPAGPDISRLAPHLQQEWHHASNACLGRVTITPMSARKVWWSRGMCKAGQPHRWQATVYNRTRGSGCPYEAGRTVCPCNDLAHNHPDVAAEWDWEANGERTPATVAASCNSKVAWKCRRCGYAWSAQISPRTHAGAGCPECGRKASRHHTKQPSISTGASHLLAEWDYDANGLQGWHPDRITLGSHKKVHWRRLDECKLGLVHKWQAMPNHRVGMNAGSPFPYGMAVCACNSLAVQCPDAAALWDHQANGGVTPDNVTAQSSHVMYWKGPDGNQWQQMVVQVVDMARRRKQCERSLKAQH